jgi:hypothetical protein
MLSDAVEGSVWAIIKVLCQSLPDITEEKHEDSVRTSHKRFLSYTNQSVNDVQRNNRCLFWDSYKTHKYSPYRAVNTLRLSYTNQSLNVV